MIKKYLYLVFLILFSISCKEIAEKTSEVIIENQKKEISGKYHTIKAEKIKAFLPDGFKYISQTDYLKNIKKTRDSITYRLEKKKIESNIEENNKMYFFENFKKNSIINIFPVKHLPFSNEEAKYMLAIIDKSIKEETNPNIEVENIGGEFKGNKNISIFKAIYRFKEPKSTTYFYRYTYFISSSKKSCFIYINTPILFDYNPYIQKIRL